MKRILTISLLFIGISVFAQEKDLISVKAIENGLSNRKYLIAELLEKDFVLDKEKGNDYWCLMNGKEKLAYVSYYDVAGMSCIKYQVRKDLQKSTLTNILKNISLTYPYKTSEESEITTTIGGKETYELQYELCYSKDKPKIQVKVLKDPSSVWVQMDFLLKKI